MSWKRIFKTARRLGTPVIVADEDGNEPVVVLPLDAYEKMSGSAPEAKRHKVRDEEDDELTADRMASIFESAMESLEEENLSKESQKNQNTGMDGVLESEVPGSVLEAEMPLEDKYYFEPLEDEPKK